MSDLIERLRDRAAQIYADYGDTTDEDLHIEAANEIERLEAIVARLPTTADGVSVVPRMKVWFRDDIGDLAGPICGTVLSVGRAVLDVKYDIDDEYEDDGFDGWCQDFCYSTHAAAKAARENA